MYMPSIIIYSTDNKYLDKTIDEILDTTPSTLIDEIIVCDDVGSGYARSGVKTQLTNRIGRANAWNLAALTSVGEHLIFIKDKTKPSINWISGLVSALNDRPQSIVSPIVHTLDLSLWSSTPSRWKRFGWRWDLNLYDRICPVGNESPAISSYCIACTKSWFNEIGGFDSGMNSGGGEDIELSLRCWLLGGSVHVCDDSIISVALELDYNTNTINNLARIVEAWMPEYATNFYNAHRIDKTKIITGRLTNLIKAQEKQRRAFEWFLNTKQPELIGVYGLKSAATNKNIAVVGCGPSLDYINHAMINRHDVIIGVDYAGLLFDCDFVMTDTLHVAIELQKKYDESKLVVPTMLYNRIIGEIVPTSELLPSANQFEYANKNSVIVSVDPPFCDFDNIALTAIHFALFLNPSNVTIYGCDNKIVDGKSHTSRIEYYDGGKLWPDNDGTRRRFALYEYGIDQLGKIAVNVGIPLIRVSHA